MKKTWAILLVAAIVVVAGSALGSGAFTVLTADRTASIDVAGDESALLGITPHSSETSSEVFVDSGHLRIEVSPGATTTYEKLFNVTNQGTQPVAVWIEDHDHVGGGGSSLAGDIIGNQDEENTGNVTFFNPTYGGNASCENDVPSVEGAGNAVQLSPGDTLVVGLQVNTSDVSGEEADLLDAMTIHADASVDGVTDELDTAC